ncbi:MAG: hypothetical protein HZY73_07280 [Micropruina sp.]|nr:MAG: hypothetical protein HZY73_07280 [Micropruina sp.]
MTLQSERRRNPYPLTWELPVGILTGWLVLAGIGVQVARGVANLIAGGGWAWPAGRALFTSLPAVLAGNPRAGLATHGGAAGPALLYAALAVVELAITATTVLAARWVWRRWGDTAMKGMASPAEAEQVLGLTRLRRHAAVIRPDLHRPPTTVRSHP